MTTESNILFEWKRVNKALVFFVYYLTKSHLIKSIKYSYIKEYNNDTFIQNMSKVSSNEDFLKWLTPTSSEFKNNKDEIFHTNS